MGRWAALLLAGAVTLPPGAAVAGLVDSASKADAERAVQAYLALWSDDADVNAMAVARFYAPHAVYYGRSMSRAEILADKRAYIRAWPVRRYSEVPGTLDVGCNQDRSRCRVSVVMAWHRTDRAGRSSTGRARIRFEFVPSEGGRKIARESAAIL